MRPIGSIGFGPIGCDIDWVRPGSQIDKQAMTRISAILFVRWQAKHTCHEKPDEHHVDVFFLFLVERQ